MKVAELVRVRWLLGTLLIAAATLFAVGIAMEGDIHQEPVAAVEAGEHNGSTEQVEHNEQPGVSETGEGIFGINLESTRLVAFAVIISAALAVATWRRDHKLVLLAAALFAVTFAALDVVEFSHQISQSAAMVAVIAGIIAVLHTGAAVVAEQRRTSTR